MPSGLPEQGESVVLTMVAGGLLRFRDDSGGGNGAGFATFESRLDGFERDEVEGAES
jgi:hypothetical protein